MATSTDAINLSLSIEDLEKIKNLSPALKITIVKSDWNSDITSKLEAGTIKTLIENGILQSNIYTFNVPGALELVYASKRLIQTRVWRETHRRTFDALIVIGCIIKGETLHFENICQGVVQGISTINSKGDLPVIFCVLTDQTHEQSLERCGGKYGNKGNEAAISAIKMALFKRATAIFVK